MTQEMTSRERLWAVLNHEQPDRVPIWMLYPRERYGSYVDVHTLPSYARVMPHIWNRTDWLDRRNIASGAFYTAAAQIETHVEVRDGWTITRRILHTPLGDLTSEHRQDEENAAGARNFKHRVRDVPAVIDQLEEWNRVPNHPLYHRMDLTRIAMTGHSFGAVTAQALGGQTFLGGTRDYADKRIALDLDDGVKVNYGKFGDLLAEVKAVHGKKPEGV